MKNFGQKVVMGGSGTIPTKCYKSRGLRNKRKAHWANERRVAQMLKENREKELIRRQQEQEEGFDNFDE